MFLTISDSIPASRLPSLLIVGWEIIAFFLDPNNAISFLNGAYRNRRRMYGPSALISR